MRVSVISILLVTAAPALGQHNQAETLFRSMEKKILAAKSVKLVCVIEATDGGTSTAKCTSTSIDSGDLAHIQFEGTANGKSAKGLILSDGVRAVITRNGVPQLEEPTAPGFGRAMRIALLTTGVRDSSPMGPTATPQSREALLQSVGDFTLGAKERIGSHDAQAIAFTCFPNNPRGAQVTLWIDEQTLLPVKREVVWKDTPGSLLTELYTDVELDVEADPGLFKVPERNEAEKLFKNMEKNVQEAKTVNIVCDVQTASGGKIGTAKASWQIAPGNKMHYECEQTIGPHVPAQMLVVSDGTICFVRGDGRAKSTPGPLAQSKETATIIARHGVFMAMCDAFGLFVEHGAHTMGLGYDFRFAAPERVGQIGAQVIECCVPVGKVKVWIDPKTTLPLKRQFTSDDGSLVITEVYREFLVDQQFDLKLFELPEY